MVKPLLLAAGCVALADWLFYGWQIGISLALFLAALGIAGVASNRVHATRRIQIAMAAIFVAGLLASVAAGLVLMLIQIKLRKPNSWLISANAVSLALVLYGCCFINAPRLVASYNVEHSRENGGTGPNLDLRYLASLGPQALPPIETAVNKIPVLWSIARDTRYNYEIALLSANWRGFDFRTWRLDRYLANNPDVTQKPLVGDKG